MGLWTKGIERSRTGKYRTEITGEATVICNRIKDFINRWMSARGNMKYMFDYEFTSTGEIIWRFYTDNIPVKSFRSILGIQQIKEETVYLHLAHDMMNGTDETLVKLSCTMFANNTKYVDNRYDNSFLYLV